ncbi:MAG: HEPN domain-containing protein [bacterium]
MTVQNRIRAVLKLQEKSEMSMKESELLFEQGFYGSAISRSYYAMLYLARAVLATKDISRKKHSGVLSVFAEQFTKPGLISSDSFKKFRKAFEERLIADYDFEITKTEKEAKEIMTFASEFSNEVNQFLKTWLEEN